MPNRLQIEPPPYHDPDTNSQEWRTWFSLLREQIHNLDIPDDGGTTTPSVEEYTSVTMIAGENILAGQVVYANTSGNAQLCDNTDITTRNVLGLALGDANAGFEVEVGVSGAIPTPSVWSVGVPLYVGTSGYLTQTPPTTGYTKILGVTKDSTTLVMHWEPSVKLFEDTAPTYAELIDANIPYAHYKLDDSTNVALDSSGNGINGSYLNSPSLLQDPLVTDGGNSVLFGPTDEHVSIPESVLGSGFGVCSIVGWFKTSGFGAQQTIVSYERSAFTSTNYLSVRLDGTGRPQMVVNDTTYTATTSLTADTIYSFCLVNDPTNEVSRLYINGALVLNESDFIAFTAPTKQFLIGVTANGAQFGSQFNGNIDNITIFTSVLDSQTILDLNSAGRA